MTKEKKMATFKCERPPVDSQTPRCPAPFFSESRTFQTGAHSFSFGRGRVALPKNITKSREERQASRKTLRQRRTKQANRNRAGTSLERRGFFWRNCSPRRSRAIVLSDAGLTFLVFFFCRFALTRYASARTHQQNLTPHKKVSNSRTREKGAFRWVRGRAR